MSAPTLKDVKTLHAQYQGIGGGTVFLEKLCASRRLQAAVSIHVPDRRSIMVVHQGALRVGKYPSAAGDELHTWAMRAIVGHSPESLPNLRSGCTIVVACDQDGSVHVVSWSSTEEGCANMRSWLDVFVWPQITIVPFRTVYGWGNGGKPEPLNWNEERALEREISARKLLKNIMGDRA